MAAAMTSIVKEVKDITECPICAEMFSNPKMLPCFHTFCLKCIGQYCKDKEEGDTMPCPMCRREFIIPKGGLSKLNVNFFIDRLIDAQSASGIQEVVNCDVCLTGKQCIVDALSFCIECQENMCDPCSKIHKSMKMSMHHHVSTIGDPTTIADIKNKSRRTFCDKHPKEEIKFFCRDCKIPFCTTCFIAKHNKHECCEIGEIVEEFKKGFKQHYDDVGKLLIKIKQESEEVDKQLATFSVCIDTTERNLLERSEEIKRMVERHTQALIAKLSSHKIQYLKSIQNKKEELQRNLMMCESFVSYCQKAIEKADSVESIRIADELKTRAGELKGERIPKLNTFPDIQFLPSDLDVAKTLDNIVGNIHVFEFTPQGLAISNDEMFCVFFKYPDIRVYNIEPFSFLRTITVERMKRPWDKVAEKKMKRPWDIVAGENVLYVSEYEDKLIHRIKLPEETVSSWSADGVHLKLSISKDGNVIVASWRPAKIFEYTSDGTFVREIVVDQIDPDLVGLHHAIQLEGDKFLVCHAKADTHHRVCIIDNTGRVIKSYGGNEGSGKGHLHGPVYLAIGQNGSILVADCNNNRIVQLSASLEYVNELVGFNRPVRIILNKELGRLYVINGGAHSITILDM